MITVVRGSFFEPVLTYILHQQYPNVGAQGLRPHPCTSSYEKRYKSQVTLWWARATNDNIRLSRLITLAHPTSKPTATDVFSAIARNVAMGYFQVKGKRRVVIFHNL
ncbi:hypothetical protein [Coleofasciculus sp. F4-SAH-05]|uniref:hypothetical protein n=1 Tax=Coleofasciculus sp. F4-SAH-05 TaxID=3069525 RepID=UPI0032F5E2D4